MHTEQFSPHEPHDSLVSHVIAFISERGGSAWLVGGYVRDQLLGRSTHDVDLVVPEGGIRLACEIAGVFDGAFFVLDEERDVGRAILQDEAGDATNIDVACLRAPDLLDDLSLRDFTINAMAVELNLSSLSPPGEHPLRKVVDPFDGLGDLRNGLLRAVTEGAFRDDPLRTLRGVRHAVELGFHIEDATFNLIRRDAPLLAAVAGERVRDELVRIIQAPGAWRHLRLLNSLDLLRQTLPEVSTLIGISQSPPHYQDVFDHTRSVIAHLEGIYALLWPGSAYHRPKPVADDPMTLADAAQWADLAEVLGPYVEDLRAHLALPLAAGRLRQNSLWWAALAHDWGKPAMRTVDGEGRSRFLEHDHWGALLAQTRTQALKFSADEIEYISRLVDLHMYPGRLAHDYPPSRRSVYRFFRNAAGTGPDCVLLSLADYSAIRAGNPNLEPWERRLKTAGLLLETYFRARMERVDPPPLLDGRRIMAEFGLRPGPHIGCLLDGLREAQAVGEVTTLDQALAWLTEHVSRGE